MPFGLSLPTFSTWPSSQDAPLVFARAGCGLIEVRGARARHFSDQWGGSGKRKAAHRSIEAAEVYERRLGTVRSTRENFGKSFGNSPGRSPSYHVTL